MSCSHLETCPLFAHFALHPALSLWQQRYCREGFDDCVRFSKSKSGENISATLLPNGHMLTVEDADSRVERLFNAIQNGEVSTVANMFESAELDVNAYNATKTTGLMLASMTGSLQMVSVFLHKKADLSLTNINGDTAYDLALKTGNHHIANTLEARSNRQEL